MPDSVVSRRTITLDGQSYEAVRVHPSQRGISTTYLPNVQGQDAPVQLAPIVEETWHRGAGASRKMLPGMYGWTRNGWPCDAGLVGPMSAVSTVDLPNQNGDCTRLVEQDGNLYVAAGQYVSKLAGGAGTPTATAEQDLGAAAVDMQVFGSSVYVSVGAAGSLWQKPSLGAWTQAQTGAAAVPRGYMGHVFWTVGSVTGERLVAQVGADHSIAYVAADPRNDGDWSAVISLGSYVPSGPLVATRDHIYLPTTRGLLDLDSSGLSPNLTPEAETEVFPTNGLATLANDGWVYYGLGFGLRRVRVANTNQYADVENVTPMNGLANESPVRGLPLAITRYGDYVILALYDASSGVTGGTTYVCWGRESLGGYGQYAEKAYAGREVGPMVWHCAPLVLDGVKVTSLHVSSLWVDSNGMPDPLLFLGCTDADGTRRLRTAQLPVSTFYTDLRAGRALSFQSSYDLYESAEDGGDDTMPKSLPDITVEGENLGSGASLALSIAFDGSTLYTPIGTANNAPRSLLRPASEQRGDRFTLKWTGSGSISVPAILRKRSVGAIPRPDRREVRQYHVVLDRGQDGVAPRVRKAQLAALATGAPVTLKDEDQQQLTVMLSGPLTFTEGAVLPERPNDRTLVADVTLVVLTQSVGGFTWDDGTTYDDATRGWS